MIARRLFILGRWLSSLWEKVSQSLSPRFMMAASCWPQRMWRETDGPSFSSNGAAGTRRRLAASLMAAPAQGPESGAEQEGSPGDDLGGSREGRKRGGEGFRDVGEWADR